MPIAWRRPTGPPLRLVGVAVRDLDRARANGVPAELLTDAPAHLVASPEVDAIVEVMGGDEPARTLIAAALGAGKPVVTANKHVVAHHGPELEALARADRQPRSASRRRSAGGTPVLGPLARRAGRQSGRRCVRGIVNGTTNHILTAMTERGPRLRGRPRRRPGRGLRRGRPDAATSRATTPSTSWSSSPGWRSGRGSFPARSSAGRRPSPARAARGSAG